jgi:glycosyltransferase involved in cell wall biosynthesis
VVVASLAGDNESAYIPELKKLCTDVHVFRMPRWRQHAQLVRGIIGSPPGSAAKFFDPRFGRLIEDCIRRYGIDIVELQHLNTAAYFRYTAGVPVILREHNVEYKVWERHAKCTNGILERLYVQSCVARVRDYEARMATRFSRCITVSQADERYLRTVAPSATIETIPSGVDSEYFFPIGRPEQPFSMVLTGSFEWRPKQHNLRVLLEQILPAIREKVPEATLTIVGVGVPSELRLLGDRIGGVRFTGPVPDVRDYVRSASLVLNYLESGGGIALKVLEAMAMRKAVLSNSLGVEGIQVQHGKDVFIADGVKPFAEAAAYLLRDNALRERLANGGYDTVRRSYCWDYLSARFEDLYSAVIAEANEVPAGCPEANTSQGGQ